jgi:hypothetical protein
MKILLCALCATLPLLAQEPVRYAVSFPNAAHHKAEVRALTCDLSGDMTF